MPLYNSSEFYRGKRKKSGPAFIATVIVLSLIAFVVLLFYGLQKYIVVTNNGVHLEIPMLMEDFPSSENNGGGTVRNFEKVDAELVIGEADYSNVVAAAGENLEEIRAVYVPSSAVSESGIESYVSRLKDANALILDVKTNSGQLVWSSESEIAVGYGTSGKTDLKSLVSSLKERNIYVAARVCCLADSLLASRHDSLTLKTSMGVAYSDGSGAWLDPCNSVVKNYIVSLCKELAGFGFDEIILLGMRLPNTAPGVEFAFNSNTTSKPTPLTAVAGFAIDTTRALKGCDAKISVQITGDKAYTDGEDAVTGQSAALFFKIFDRVYISAPSETAGDSVLAGQDYITLGDINRRIVPMCSDGTPQTACWVLMK